MTEQAPHVKCIVLDVDGVLTDGKLYYDSNGNVSKCFNVQDGLIIKTALQFGMKIAIITGRNDTLMDARVKDLGIADYYPGRHAKLEALEEIRSKYGIDYDEMSFVGDDWIDIDPMQMVGYPIAVANARQEVKAIAQYTTRAKGGEGAVREAIEHIFALQNITTDLLARVWMQI